MTGRDGRQLSGAQYRAVTLVLIEHLGHHDNTIVGYIDRGGRDLKYIGGFIMDRSTNATRKLAGRIDTYATNIDEWIDDFEAGVAAMMTAIETAIEETP